MRREQSHQTALVNTQECEVATSDLLALAPSPTAAPSPVRPFLVGTLVGGLAGAALGTVLSRHTRGFFVGLYHLLSRRLSSSDRDQLRFELLLQ
jgi:predicted lipid-binding transport protein (Tim44 family)